PSSADGVVVGAQGAGQQARRAIPVVAQGVPRGSPGERDGQSKLSAQQNGVAYAPPAGQRQNAKINVMGGVPMIELSQLAPRADQAPSTPPYRQPIGYPGAWKTTDFSSPRDYTLELKSTQLDDIDDAVRNVRAAGLALEDIEQRH